MPTPIGIIGDFFRRAPGDENTNHDFEAVIKGNPGVQGAMTRGWWRPVCEGKVMRICGRSWRKT